jgi:hypothetical protein
MIYGITEILNPFSNIQQWALTPYFCLSQKGTDYLERRNAEILSTMDSDLRAEMLLEMNGIVVGDS